MFRYFLLLLSLFSFATASNAQSIWTDVLSDNAPVSGERRIIPQHYRLVRLNLNELQPVLASAPERFTSQAETEATVFSLPMPDGRTMRFRLTESPVMAPELQAKYPETRCYTGKGIDDPSVSLKCDLTPWGFHAMILSPREGTIFIDPYAHGNTEYYIVYFKKDHIKDVNAPYTCETPDSGLLPIKNNASKPELQGDCKMRKYRLALACTGEYAAFFGGTKPLVLAAMNTTMNRVNGVYENELAITMQLVAKNDTLIFLNASSDPYTNNNGGTMLNQNQTTCNNRIGSANYDIGHVFSTGGGGIAGLGVVCSNSKAQGVTGSSSPVGDGFDIDYVAHEMGHEFGGNHTFNGTLGSCNGNVNQSTAHETGSGTTIMAYAGICSTQDVQPHSDDYFHAASIQEIAAYTTTGVGNNCPVKIITGNSNPTVNGGADYTIPKSTYFALTASGSDINGDTITYCWEQMDPEASTQPPVATSTKGPLFRSFKGTTSPTRYFPRLVDIINNANPAWEKLPSVARTMKFRVTVRDNHAGGGCTGQDDVVVTVSAASGPFQVTAPNTNVIWMAGETQTVTWNVSNSNAAPVNCANVKISLSTDGGYTYPVVLASSVPNNGSANVIVPNNISTTCRVKVEAVGNVFFDISNQNFQIKAPPAPTFTLAATTSTLEVCAGATTSFGLTLTSVNNFNTPVQISVTGGPAGAVIAATPNPLTPTGMTTVNISGLTPAMAGNYTLAVQATGSGVTQTVGVQLSVLPGAPADAPITVSPANGAQQIPAGTATLAWNSTPNTQGYVVTVATDPVFTPSAIVFTQTVTGTSVQPTGLLGSTVYYWIVQGTNDCGTSPVSTVIAFQTADDGCGHFFASTDVPKIIDSTMASTVVSTLSVPATQNIGHVKVHLIADHTYVGDLIATLTTPWNTVISLFDQPGAPADQFGCPNDNLDLIFDDAAAQTASDLENTCSPGGIALQGTFQPITPLSATTGHTAQGTWKVSIIDTYQDDGGLFKAWSLDFCFPTPLPTGSILTDNPLTVASSGNGEINNTYLSMALSGTTIESKMTVLTLPQHGTLTLNGTPVSIGTNFTQANINAGLLVYTHNGDNAATDKFRFDALDLHNQAWVHDSIFNIVIVHNNLVATATQTIELLCYNGTDGQITVAATGLDGQYQYSLNGGPLQASNVFSNLGPGTYTITVSGQLGFTASASAVTISNPVVLAAANSVSNYTVSVAATGGTGSYQYSSDGVNFQPSNVFDSLGNGVYTIVVRDENGCTATTQAIVAVNTLLVAANIDATIHCNGGSDGRIIITAGGGRKPFTYSLNGGPFVSTDTFAGLPAGMYTVIVHDSLGFEATTNTLTLTDPLPLTLSGNAVLNVITVSGAGGTGTLMYSIDGQSFQASGIFGNLANGVYTMVARDANGCTASTQATVAVPVLALTTVQTQNIPCNGLHTGEITVTGSGGVTPYTYSIGNNQFQSGNVFSGLGAGSYTVTIRDAAGTQTETTTSISEPSAIIPVATSLYNSIAATATGGTGPLTYSIDGQSFQSVGVFTNLPNGLYTVVVRDSTGCNVSVPVTVFVAPLGIVPAVTQTIKCSDDLTGQITATGSGGIPPYQFNLNGGAFQSGNIFSDLAAGAYSVGIKDSQGAYSEQVLIVSQPAPLSVTTDVVGNNASVIITGGTSPYTYTLNGAPVTDFTNLPIGHYELIAKDANGCTSIDEFDVFGNTINGSVQVITSTVKCPGDANGAARICVNGGYPPLTLEFSPSGSLVPDTGFCDLNMILKDLMAGDYSVIVTDVHGYTQTLTFSINEPTVINVTGTTVKDTIFTTATGGTGALQYSINGGMTFQDSPVFPNLQNGTYTVLIKDSNGCTATSGNIVVNVVAVVEPGITWGLTVSPNPGPGRFVLEMQQAPQFLEVGVFDAAGRNLHQWYFEPINGTFSTELDLSSLPQGVYFLRLTDGKNTGGLRLSVVR